MRQAFELRLLEWAGFGLDFARCRHCAAALAEEPQAIFFVASRGGAVCVRCRSLVADGALRMESLSAVALVRLGSATFSQAPPLHCPVFPQVLAVQAASLVPSSTEAHLPTLQV